MNSNGIKPTSPEQQFYYGGQALIEGVMIRGSKHLSVSVRKPDGAIESKTTVINQLFTGSIKKIPFIRGSLLLLETMFLGIKSLIYSANISAGEEEEEIGNLGIAVSLSISLAFTILVFFILPLVVVEILDRTILSAETPVISFISNMIEGIIRLCFFVLYIWLIGFMPDIKRVFQYHGAEHMTVKAYEADLPLNIANIRQFSTAHPRCGTAFLLLVMIISVITFAFLGRPDLWLRLSSRIFLIPLIAGIAYEILRFTGKHSNNIFVKCLIIPNMALQRLTTNQPEDDQIEIAIDAMQNAITADQKK
jgi:uncharacterized protein YqhQ